MYPLLLLSVLEPRQYIQNIRADDKMTLRNLSRLMRQDYNMTVTRSKLQRARRIAMKLINGDEENKYIMLWDYTVEIRKSNPGSRIHGTSIGYTCHSMHVRWSFIRM